MTLRVINVPAPAVATDWRYTIPAQWLVHVTAIQATLNTEQPLPTVADSSGNGQTLQVLTPNGHLLWGSSGPYGGGANDYAVRGTLGAPFPGPQLHNFGSSFVVTDPFTIEALVNLDSGVTTFGSCVFVRASGSTQDAAILVFANGAANATVRGSNAGFTFVLGTAMLPPGGWHHVAATADGVDWRVYLDGVLFNTVAGHQPAAIGSQRFWVAADGTAFPGSVAAVATYPSALTAGQQLAHIAAMGSNAAYKAAVLADAPSGLWMLDDRPAAGSRTATLRVTDGTTTVAQYPGGTITGYGPTFSWTWATNAPGISQSADATANYVAIPNMTLPGGYTIGTITPDLTGTDQWSDISIWWDDGAIGPSGPLAPYEYPPGVFLKYQQEIGGS